MSNAAVPTETYISDLRTTGEALNGAYIKLAQDFYPYGGLIYADIIADNIKLAAAAGSNLVGPYYWTQTSSNSASGFGNDMNKAWLLGYYIIRHCNLVLEKVDKYKNEDINKANDLKAQAYGLRAWVHFSMVNVFAQSYTFTADASHPGIPYVTVSDWTQPVMRNTVAEVYANLISDLTTALPLFSSGTQNTFFMNSNAAKALLARIYLFKGDYQAAKNMATGVAKVIPIMAAGANGYPSKLYTDKDTEVLFRLNPSQSGLTLPSPNGSYTGTYTTNFQARFYVSPKLFVATADIATILAQGYQADLRKVWVQPSGNTWNITKFPQSVIAGFSAPSASYYETLLRSSEMYLTAAESYARLNNDDSARYFVNEIRKRASIPELPVSVNGSVLLDSIYIERRKELAFEGIRMYDLLRWKKGVNRNDTWSQTLAKNLPYPSNNAIAPIPLRDVEAYGLPQNPGY